MSKLNIKLTTQLDYIKTLIEENRYGEASDAVINLNADLEDKVRDMREKIETQAVSLPKSLTRTKPNEWLLIKDDWYKMRKITKTELVLEINKQNVITKAYSVIKESAST